MEIVESTISRTFKQQGLAFSVSDGSPGVIEVFINGKIIYNGPVPGTPDPSPGYDPDFDMSVLQDLFTWPVDIDFAGPVDVQIMVWNCVLLLGATVSNYSSRRGNHAEFCGLDHIQVIDGIKCQDPFTNVRIAGQPVQRGAASPTMPGSEAPYAIPTMAATDVPLTGQWGWEVVPSCEFEATLNIPAGRNAS